MLSLQMKFASNLDYSGGEFMAVCITCSSLVLFCFEVGENVAAVAW